MVRRASVWAIWSVVVALAVAVTTVGSHGQTVKEEPKDQQKPGIYFESIGEGGKIELIKLDASMPSHAGGGSMNPFKKPSITTTIAGDRASRRLLTTQPSFLFVFGRATMAQMMENPGEAMNNPPPNTTSPKEFALTRLPVVDGNRTAKRDKSLQVACTVESVSNLVYRVRPEQAMEAGEYGISYVGPSGMGGGMVWDFGVDAAK
jgi:hypothetical protein